MISGRPEAVGGEVELRCERCITGAELEGFGDCLIIDGLVTLLEGGVALLEHEDEGGGGGPGQDREDGDGVAPFMAAAGGGTFAGMQEVTLDAGEGRVTGRVR